MATKFLDYTGLSYLWNKIKTYAGNFACTAAKALGIHFVIPNETEQTATLTATITGITSYFVGLTVALRMPFNTPASATLNINNLGAKPIYYKVNTTSANYYPADTVVLLVYETTTLNTGCFKMVYAYDSNTNNATAQNISTNNNTFPVLICHTANATANVGNKATYFCKDVKINPSTGILSANGFVGDVTGNASTASAVAWSGVTSKPTTIAGYGITDAKIANGTITLGSNSITPLTSVPSHNQASNTITAMTGYSKPSSGSAIAASDSLNAAVGKLEAKVDAYDDSNYVHKTGDETINGKKTFEDTVICKDEYLAYINDTTAGIYKEPFKVYDSNRDRIFFIRCFPNGVTSGAFTGDVIHTLITPLKDGTNTIFGGQIVLGMDSNNIPYCAATETSSSRSYAGDIITRGFLAGADSNVVHRTGNETVAGNKTFTGVTYAKGTIVEKPDLTGTDVNKSWLQFHDSADDTVFIIRTYPNGYGSYADYSFLQTMHKSGSTTVYGGKLILGYDTENSCPFVACSDTSSARTSSSDVITRGYLAGSNSNVVHRTGNESIAGNKTFSGLITAPFIDSYVIQNGDASLASIYGYDPQSTTQKGATMNAYGAQYRAGTSTGATYGGSVRFVATNSSASCEMLLRANGTATWNGQTIQTSSDERLKTPLSAVPDDVLDAWDGVEWGQFQFLGAVAEKGGSARLHAGLIAQAVVRAFEARGLDACRYGILCHEFRDAFEDDPGEDLWTVRYAEALCMEAAYMRRENARLKKRVSDLEDRLAALELRLGSE